MSTKKIELLELREYILPKQIELVEDKINELVEAVNSLPSSPKPSSMVDDKFQEVSEKIGQPKPSKSGELKDLKQSIIKALKKKYSYSEKLTLEEVLEIINSHWEGESSK